VRVQTHINNNWIPPKKYLNRVFAQYDLIYQNREFEAV